jgi:hypothetical protein
MLIPDSKQSPHERNSLMKFRCGHNLWDDDAPPKFKHPEITTHELQQWKITQGHAVAKPAGLEFLNSIRDTQRAQKI